MLKTALLPIFVIYLAKCLKFLSILSLHCFLLLFRFVVWNISNVQEMFQILNNLSVKTSIPGLGFVSKYTLISTRFFLSQGMWTRILKFQRVTHNVVTIWQFSSFYNLQDTRFSILVYCILLCHCTGCNSSYFIFWLIGCKVQGVIVHNDV